MDRVAEEHPIAGDYEDDARHNRTERWFALWELSVASPPQKPAETPASPEVEARREIARRFSGPEGDAAAEETDIVSRWKGAGENGDTAETIERWVCSECKRTDITKDEVMLDNGISLEGVLGHLVTGEGWPSWWESREPNKTAVNP